MWAEENREEEIARKAENERAEKQRRLRALEEMNERRRIGRLEEEAQAEAPAGVPAAAALQ